MSEKYILAKSDAIIYFVTDLEGNITYQNDMFTEYMSHIRPKSVFDILADDSDHESCINTIKKSNDTPNIPFKVWLKMKQKNGGLKWHKLEISTLLDEMYFLGHAVNDITSVTQDEYHAQSRLIQEISFMINHDNIQPLDSALGLINMLPKTLDEKLFKMLKKAVENAIEAQTKLAKKVSRKPYQQ